MGIGVTKIHAFYAGCVLMCLNCKLAIWVSCWGPGFRGELSLEVCDLGFEGVRRVFRFKVLAAFFGNQWNRLLFREPKTLTSTTQSPETLNPNPYRP